MQKMKTHFAGKSPWILITAILSAILITSGVYVLLFQGTPPGKRTLVLLAGGFLLVTLIGFVFFADCLIPRWKLLKITVRLLLVVGSLATALLSVLNYREVIPPIYFLEPGHTLEITVVDQKNSPSLGNKIEITGFNTGITWESFNSFEKKGEWVNGASSLSTVDITAALIWQGNIGAHPGLVFRGSPDGGAVKITADGADEQIVDLYRATSSEILIHPAFSPEGFEQTRILSMILIGVNAAVIAFFLLILMLGGWIAKDNATLSGLAGRLFAFISGIPPVWKNILFVAVCAAIACLQIGDFHGRMAIVHGDDSPLTYSFYLVHPERFSNDIISTYAVQQIYATIQNWLPALLYRYLSVIPEIPSLIIIYLQYILLGFSIRHLTRVITGREVTGWLAAFFLLAANPWEWNMANYGGILFYPYAGHMVIAFILFAFSDVLEARNNRAMLWLFLGGLFHPTFILYAIGMIAAYWVIQPGRKFNLIPWLFLVLVGISTVIPRLFVIDQLGKGDLLAFNEMKKAIVMNMHMQPLILEFPTPRTNLFYAFLPVIFIALRERKNVIKRYLWLLLCVFLGVVASVIITLTGWTFEILPFIQLIAHRSSNLLVIAGIPLVLTYLLRNIESRNPAVSLYSMAVISILMFSGSHFLAGKEYLLVLWMLLLADMLSGRFGPFDLPWKDVNVTNQNAVESSWIVQPPTLTGLAVVVTFALLSGITLYNSWKTGDPARAPQALAEYDVQMWARNNTPENATIINMERSFSQRASVATIPYNWYIYNRSKACKQYIDRFAAFSREYAILHGSPLDPQNPDEEGVMGYAAEFGANYILRTVDHPLKFEEVYSNTYFILYKIPSAN